MVWQARLLNWKKQVQALNTAITHPHEMSSTWTESLLDIVALT